MFRKVVGVEAEGVLSVHVDDSLVSTHGQATMEQLISDIGKHFAMKGLGEASYYLGYHTARKRHERVFELDEHLNVKIMAERLGLIHASIVPAVACIVSVPKANRPQADAAMEDLRGIAYREAVGALM